MKFKSTLLLGGKNATGIQVPDKVVADLNAGKKPAVKINVNGYQYRSTIAVMGGVFMIPFSEEHRKISGIKAGDKIDVDITIDTEPRVTELPDELKKALHAKSNAFDKFNSLAPSKIKEFVRQVNDAKTPETKSRRIVNIVESL